MSYALTPTTGSPFDALRREDERGEYWSARDLMTPLGYLRWERFEDAIERGQVAIEVAGQIPDMHISGFAAPGNGVGAGATRADFRMTREGVYAVIQGADPRKPEIAAAWAYFRVKTREAEVTPARPDLSNMDVLLAVVTQMRDAERALLAVERRQIELEAKVSAGLGEYNEFTTLAYAKLNDLPTDRISCQMHGQRASKLMRSRGDEPRKRQDATFGTVNVYPVAVLEETAEAC